MRQKCSEGKQLSLDQLKKEILGYQEEVLHPKTFLFLSVTSTSLTKNITSGSKFCLDLVNGLFTKDKFDFPL